MNAEMKGIDINFTRIGSYEPEVRKTFSEDTTYGCARLMCNVTYTVIVGARNKLGISQWQSTIIVQRWQSSKHDYSTCITNKSVWRLQEVAESVNVSIIEFTGANVIYQSFGWNKVGPDPAYLRLF